MTLSSNGPDVSAQSGILRRCTPVSGLEMDGQSQEAVSPDHLDSVHAEVLRTCAHVDERQYDAQVGVEKVRREAAIRLVSVYVSPPSPEL